MKLKIKTLDNKCEVIIPSLTEKEPAGAFLRLVKALKAQRRAFEVTYIKI